MKVMKIVVLQTDFSRRMYADAYIAVQTATKKYEVVYAEQLTNGTNTHIVRKLKKRTINFNYYHPTWSTESEVDIATPSGLTNPVSSARSVIGYDFDSDEFLIALGEWDTVSGALECTTVKLLSVTRDFQTVTVLHADLLTLAKTAIADADVIQAYAHFWGYGGKLVGVLGTYAGAAERACIVTYNGGWIANHVNSRFDFIQQYVEPIFNASDVFIGWLTEGHGTNSHFVKTDLSIVTCYPPAGLFTTAPVYDMVNHKIVWIEWGSAAGAIQYIHTADPDATTGCTNYLDKTPTGTLTDNEGNTIDLQKTNKLGGQVFYDNQNYRFLMRVHRKDLPAGVNRNLETDLGIYNDGSLYDIINNPDKNDKFGIYGTSRTVDPTNKVLLPNPMILTQRCTVG